MKNFGAKITEKPMKNEVIIETTGHLQQTTDGFFQKCLAYSSYYIMLFVAYTMITPETMRAASKSISNLFA